MNKIGIIFKKSNKIQFFAEFKSIIKRLLNLHIEPQIEKVEDKGIYTIETYTDMVTGGTSSDVIGMLYEYKNSEVATFILKFEFSKEKLFAIAKALLKKLGYIAIDADITERYGNRILTNEIYTIDPIILEDRTPLKFSKLNPDIIKKLDKVYIVVFRYEQEDRPDSIYPNFYESIDIPVEVKFLGTSVHKHYRLMMDSMHDNKYFCERIVIGKLFYGIENNFVGAIVNDEPDILKALNKLNRRLRKKGSEIVDIPEIYKKIKSELDKQKDEK